MRNWKISNLEIYSPAFIGLIVLFSCQREAVNRLTTLSSIWYWDTCKANRLDISHSPIPDSSWDITVLPHQILLPDQAIWYCSKVVSSGDYYLQVVANDGAQVFIDGAPLPSIKGRFYNLPFKTDSSWLSIRVLNNAMHGGLERVSWLAKDSMDLIWQEQDNVLEQLEEIYLSDLYHSDVFLPEEDYHLHSKSVTKFTVWGDVEGGWDKFQSLCHHMLSVSKLEFSIGLGDIVSDGANIAQWFSFMTCLAPLIEKRVLVFPIAGHCDYTGYYDDLKPDNYIRHITNDRHSTYSFWVAGPAVFLALDPNGSFPQQLDSDQYNWAIGKMNSSTWQEATWRFILVHQPPYAQGKPGYQGTMFIRDFIDKHAEQDRIDFVLSGHCHDFEFLRKQYGSQKTNFLISGGGGGQLESESNDDRIQMDTIIDKHHYLLFELNESSALVQLFDDQNHQLWTSLFPAPKP